MLHRGHNGLLRAWDGRVWLNPPYGPRIGSWMRRMADHGWGTALVFARTETEWFFETIWRAETADAVLFLEGRLNFHHADGARSKFNAGGPSVLIAYGAEDAERLHASGLEGRFLPLSRPLAVFVAVQGAETWRDVVLDALKGLGKEATLAELYEAIENHPKARGRAHWRAKIRQTVQTDLFERTGPGRYRIPGGRA
jgi:uncharacterized cupin superfamily protein